MHKYRMLVALVILVASMVLTPLAAADPGQQPMEPEMRPNTITVNGFGTAFAPPDLAYISLGVEVMNEDVSVAVNQTNQQIQAVISALLALGIEREDIRTENFSIYQERFYGPEGPSESSTYRVSNMLRVTVRDIQQIAEVLAGAVNAGANAIYGVNYDIADRQAVASEARSRAVENARAVAEELAGLLGVSVGNVLAVADTGSPNQPMFDTYGLGGGATAESVTQPPIEVGMLGVSVNIMVTFELVR
ncbi:MAG: SIMPL domain-containing protein [Anaerolineae bacterium]|nr:SIMPL domain-containing protein [Anaerolineae bacterium]